jgi:hypothetical protein
MSVIPGSTHQQLEWLEAHLPTWQANAAAIGLSAAQVTALAALVTAARTAFDAMLIARDDSKSATMLFNNAIAAALDPARDYVKTIKAFAETSGNPDVYALANVPPPAEPVPVGAPGSPVNLSGVMAANGTLTLTWDAAVSGPSNGIVFEVARRRVTEPGFALVAVTGDKEYQDPVFANWAAMDPGAGPIEYQVRARRGNLTSAYAGPLTINANPVAFAGAAVAGMIGTSGGGSMAAAA